jgi:hypothetical protein
MEVSHLHADNKGPTILGTIAVVTALSSLFSAARIFVRGRLQGKLLLDDYLIVISNVFFTPIPFAVSIQRLTESYRYVLG